MSRANDRINKALSKHGYIQLRKVGEGSFGAAILCQDSSDKDKDTKAIVKMIDISRASRKEREDALKESKVLSQLRHPFIVKYRENFLEDGWLCIVMDYCEGGDLSDKIKKQRSQGKAFPEDQVLRWFTQAVLALKYIHDMKILHRDLKSGNFFLSKTGNLKMGDFGIARVLECTNACAQTQIGTPYYLSPEICAGKPYSWGSDIWSMGCILFEMCARKVPFDAPDLKSLIRNISQGTPPDLPGDYSANLRQLCKDMLQRNPDTRPQTQEILKKPVVQGIVKRMLQEVKDDEEKVINNSGKKRPPVGSEPGVVPNGQQELSPKYRSEPAVRSNGQQELSPKYHQNDEVEFYSETHKDWLPATITGVDAEGRIMLNIKPNVWLTLEVQAARVRRPRHASGSRLDPNASPIRSVPVSPTRRSEDRKPDVQRKYSDIYKHPNQEGPFRRHGSQGSISQTPSNAGRQDPMHAGPFRRHGSQGSIQQTPSIGGRQEVSRISTPSRGGRDLSGARLPNNVANGGCISAPCQRFEPSPRPEFAAGMPSGNRQSVSSGRQSVSSRVPTPGRQMRSQSPPPREGMAVGAPKGFRPAPDYIPSFGRAPTPERVAPGNTSSFARAPTPERVVPGTPGRPPFRY